MNYIYTYLLIIFLIITIVGAVLLVLKTSKRFNLTPEQLERIKKRNAQMDKQEKEESD